MSSSGKIISIFDYKDYNLNYTEKMSMCEKLLINLQPKENDWDFNRQFKTKKIIGYDSFCVFEHGLYYLIFCKDCKKQINLPEILNECVFCKSINLKTSKKHVGQVGMKKGMGVKTELDNNLFKSAIKDIQENPTQKSSEPDINWEQLEKEI